MVNEPSVFELSPSNEVLLYKDLQKADKLFTQIIKRCRSIALERSVINYKGDKTDLFIHKVSRKDPATGIVGVDDMQVHGCSG